MSISWVPGLIYADSAILERFPPVNAFNGASYPRNVAKGIVVNGSV
jgi:hypothetical protein